jgi:7,8-dihydropterin-6-yl-methyl-4-(beta-D-ribofuranosyl)aminobenzene 5'-phosphate synthase
MAIRLTTLCENTVGKFGIAGEWGLSILVESGNDRVLVDTGLTDSIVGNAHELEVDLKEVTQVFLSHGHADHTGGLRSLLRTARKRMTVHAHPDVWDLKYSVRNNGGQESRQFIGIPYRSIEFEAWGADFVYAKEPVRLTQEIMTTGEVPMVTDFETIDRNLFIQTDHGFEPDPLADDQALLIKTPIGLVVVLGCSHRGMINTLLHAKQISGEDRIRAVVGGTHLMKADRRQLKQTLKMLNELGVEKIGVSHCTGPEASAFLAGELGERFFFNTAGTVTEW